MNDKLISLCMIVKDEESHLERCLNSIRNSVDEIIIIDTGSTDNTKQIASTFTSHVYDFKWINDFAAARNESLKYATGKWILVMDADEYFDETGAEKLRNLLSRLEPSENTIYGVSIISFLGSKSNTASNESIVDRVFPNFKGIRYVRPIHEQPVCKNKAAMGSINLPIRIYHSGYVEETLATKNKHERNLEIFFKMKKDTGSFSAYDHLKIGSQYVMMKRYDEAMKHLQEALKRDPKELGTAYKHLLFALLQVLLETEKYIEGWIFCDQHLTEYEVYPDILTLRGMILMQLGLREAAYDYLYRAYQEAERRSQSSLPVFIVSAELAMSTPVRLLAHISEQNRNFNQAVYFLTKLIQLNPRDVVVLTKLIKILTLNEKPEVIFSFLKKVLDLDTNEVNAFLAYKISLSLGCSQLTVQISDTLQADSRIETSDQLRYALLTGNQDSFDKALNQETIDFQDTSIVTHLILGSVVWREHRYLQLVQQSNDDQRPTSKEITASLINGENISLEDSPFAYTLLSELYLINNLDTYDLIMDNVNSSILINRMANFFYDHYNEELAFQYYNHLEMQQALNWESCANIAENFYRDGNIEEALVFMKRAIALKPDRLIFRIRASLFSSGTAHANRLTEDLLLFEPALSDTSLLKLMN